MRKSTEHDIIRWHERGYTVAEIRRIMPQCTTDEITAVINNHPTENGARRRESKQNIRSNRRKS